MNHPAEAFKFAFLPNKNHFEEIYNFLSHQQSEWIILNQKKLSHYFMHLKKMVRKQVQQENIFSILQMILFKCKYLKELIPSLVRVKKRLSEQIKIKSYYQKNHHESFNDHKKRRKKQDFISTKINEIGNNWSTEVKEINLHIKNSEQISQRFPKEQCLGCMEVISEDFQIEKSYQNFFLFSQQLQNTAKDHELRLVVCAMLNLGEGYIFMTNNSMENIENGDFKLEGTYMTEEEKQYYEFQWRNYLQKYKQNIFPSFKRFLKQQTFKIDAKCLKIIPSSKNNQLKKESQSQKQEKNNYILRITVKRTTNCVFFFHTKIKGFEKKFYLYICKMNKTFKLKEEDIYQFFIFTVLKNKKQKHDDTYCHNYRCSFNWSIRERVDRMIVKKNFIQNLTLKSENFQILYQYCSVIIFPSENYLDILQLFKKRLEKNKCIFQLIEPFKSYRGQSGRTIWLISHQNEFPIIYKNFNAADYSGNCSLILTTNALKIKEQFDVNKYLWATFIESVQKKFKEKIFPKRMKSKMGEKQQSQTFILFPNLKLCIFSFLYFENLKIRSYFVSD